jgi:CHAT domain-containing protein
MSIPTRSFEVATTRSAILSLSLRQAAAHLYLADDSGTGKLGGKRRHGVMPDVGPGSERVEGAVRHFLSFGLVLAAIGGATASFAQTRPPSVQDSFRLGTDAGVLCQVQSVSTDPAIKGMFDRAYSIVCRDAAVPIGRLYALRKGADEPVARLAGLRAQRASCDGSAQGTLPDVSSVTISECALSDSNVGYRVYAAEKGRTVYVAEGLAGYDSALQLGLRTIVADRAIPGVITVATNAVKDPAAFARVQAGSLDLNRALAEGYRRNNSGSYAEAAEFFDTLLQRSTPEEGQSRKFGEYVVNRALQKSNLGQFEEADALFAEADKIATSDPVQLRLRRNFVALHLVNQQRLPEALAELDRPIAPVGDAATVTQGVIDEDVANQINEGAPMARQLGAAENVSLTPQEKAAILDAQGLQIRGTVLRLQNDAPGAKAALSTALANLIAIREGRVASITRLRAQTLAELSSLAEAAGDFGGAETLLRDAVALLSNEYPASAALNGANARLAAYLARRGQTEAAMTLYRQVVATMTASGGSTTGFENLLAPYFDLLVAQIPATPGLVDDFFLASETLVRPGVADTQAILARELSGGSDDAARLFRQSVSLTRDIERTRVELARLVSIAESKPEDGARIVEVRAELARLEADQVTVQARLADFPRYRAISTQAITLAELRGALKPNEAYLKTAVVGGKVYMILATPTEATAYATALTAAALEKKVDALRNSIATYENGQLLTYPFDVKLARELYVDLFAPVDAKLASAGNIVFEPDGALLRLPINLLITDQAGVDAYAARIAKAGADEFDFTGLAWLGRRSDVSTAVSARGFRDVRNTPPSAATQQYLGFGSNAPVSNAVQVAATRSMSGKDGIDCNWPLTAWNQPISPKELKTAQSIIGDRAANVVTGAAFSDSSVIGRTDLAQYRIVHFATHGLVAAPRPECPARPALLTSFGDQKSDGLLTFQEIYDLRLDADLVILSACDTAGAATVAATREIGVTSGGGAALDGLVRAFIGAGGRSVLASHWPLPDDYDATQRLIVALFNAPAGTPVTTALRTAQTELMADPNTSHPYYWSGLAMVGDGAQPVLRSR